MKTDLVMSKNRWKLLKRLCIKKHLTGVKYSFKKNDCQYNTQLFLPFLYQFLIVQHILNMKKVTGLGGVFFKCNDPKGMNEWYAKNLGLATSEYGTTFEWRQDDDPSKKGSTSWCTFPQDTKYFNPSAKPFMINYRVENLLALVDELKKDNVTIVDEIAEYEYGKFVHVLDPEGNIIELWEPTDDSDQDNVAG